MIDHIREHLHLAEEYAANAARIRATNKKSKRLREFSRRCTQAADRNVSPHSPMRNSPALIGW